MWTRLVGFLLLSVSLFAQAQGTQLWKQSSYENFEKGTPHGVAIGSNGSLTTSPAPMEVLTTTAAYIWSVAADSHGNVYLGTGSPAQVLKVSADGKSTPLLETKDLSVQVVRMGPDGMLYAATLPNGKVYRIDPNGSDKKATVVFDPAKLSGPQPTYLWDLAFDAQGRLYIATGGPAAIYRVDVKNLETPAEKFFSSGEQHIRCLLFAKDGTLYAGSDGRGLVYRISPQGKGFVLFEAAQQEIPAMALDPEGNLYVAAMGAKGPSSLPQMVVHSKPTLTATVRVVTGSEGAIPSDSQLIPNGTVIYRIAPDGTPRTLWTSQHDVVYALAWQRGDQDAESGLLAGSGNLGHLYRIAADGAYADLAHLEARQATGFAIAGKTIYVATSNIGKLYRLSPENAGKDAGSTYVSQVHDAKFFSQWGKAQARGAGSYDLLARVGNIEQPAEGWSDWQKVMPGTAAGLPKGRFLQWKAVLHPGASLNEVGFYYLPQNVAPVVDAIVLQLHARVDAATTSSGQATPVQINFPANTTDGVSYQVVESATPLMALRDHGWATLRWKAHDPNGDHLLYSLYYRGDGETNWQLLQKNIRHTYTSFELARIPDGGYTLRLVASDAPSHPEGHALTGNKDSGHFVLDTTPPVVSGLRAAMTNESNGLNGPNGSNGSNELIHVAFEATAKLSTISRAYYSVDAGPWRYVEPVGQLSDSVREQYDFSVPVPKRDANAAAPAEVRVVAPDQHVVAVRVVDRAGNAATAKAVVR